MIERKRKEKSVKTFAFVDASNLFYGGEKSLGWKIDYQKLLKYLKKKYGVSKTFYFGGVEIHKFDYDYLTENTVPLKALADYLTNLLKTSKKKSVEGIQIEEHLKRVKFYLKLQEFGFKLFLKPVKLYKQEDGTAKKKANCDVEMAFYIMKELDNFNGVVVLSGDGDFLPVLKYLRSLGKEVIVLARGTRTAKEIRRFAGGNFKDFEYLRFLLAFE